MIVVRMSKFEDKLIGKLITCLLFGNLITWPIKLNDH